MSLYAGLGLGLDGTSKPKPKAKPQEEESAKEETTAAPAKKDPAKKSWSVSLEMMAPQLKRKRAAMKAAKAAKPRLAKTPSTKAKVVTTVLEPSVASVAPTEPFLPVPEAHSKVQFPYDPFRPNDYEEVLAKRNQEEMEGSDDGFDDDYEQQLAENHGMERIPSPSQAVPQNLAETGDEAYLRRLRMSQGAGAAAAPQAADVPSTVVLLSNMVAPGDVDAGLTQETAEECKKFGAVVNCHVHVCPPNTVEPEAVVRIFVEFKDQAAAGQAVNTMNGRFFGGRQVQARFYNTMSFRNGQLELR